jgi:hypothetical protein
MADKTETREAPRKAMQPSLPRRPSYEKVVEDIDKWADSPGLQKPK